MPQMDDYIEQFHRLEGLMAYAEQQKDWDELMVVKSFPVVDLTGQRRERLRREGDRRVFPINRRDCAGGVDMV